MCYRLHSKTIPGVTVRFCSRYQFREDYQILKSGCGCAQFDNRIHVDHEARTVRTIGILGRLGMSPDDIKAMMVEYADGEHQDYLAWHQRKTAEGLLSCPSAAPKWNPAEYTYECD